MDIFKEKKLKPMLLSEIENPFDDEKFLFEIKFDGIRAIIYVSSEDIIIKNKRGIIINDIYPELLNIRNDVKKKCVFDGEIVLMDKGKPSFSRLQERALLKDKKKILYFKNNYPVVFVCFDILYENENLIDLSLVKRKKILSKYKDTDFFVKSRVVYDNGLDLFKRVKEMNLEGIVAKFKDSKYYPARRSDEWIKIKNVKEEEFLIGGYKEEKNIASILLGTKEDNKLRFISKVVVGKKRDDFKLIKELKSVRNKFIDFNEDGYTYITPKYKCTIQFLEKTKNGHLRHPVFKGIRFD